MSAQSYEDEALQKFNNGHHKRAVYLLRQGAGRSLGRGRSGRMEYWADVIEGNYENIKSVQLTSFFEIDERDEFKTI